MAARDPHNRLLARQSPLRLSAEQVRDVSLAASGLLVPHVGGPSVFPSQPAAVAEEGFDNKWTASNGEGRYRRGLYTYIQRLSPFAQNVTFDLPALSRSCTRRERSNTPLQALTLLNDPVFFKAATSLARRVNCDNSDDAPQRVDRLFQIGLSRVPTDDERARLVPCDETQLAAARRDDPAANADEAAWVAMASVILNLHEFITRE